MYIKSKFSFWYIQRCKHLTLLPARRPMNCRVYVKVTNRGRAPQCSFFPYHAANR